MTDDGYPTAKELGLARQYAGPIGYSNGLRLMDIEKLVELLQHLWRYDDYIKVRWPYIQLHTGGWSGNEDIIEQLNGTWFWFHCWQKSIRGGHYWFKVSKVLRQYGKHSV
jgi:hypothetical protein